MVAAAARHWARWWLSLTTIPLVSYFAVRVTLSGIATDLGLHVRAFPILVTALVATFVCLLHVFVAMFAAPYGLPQTPAPGWRRAAAVIVAVLGSSALVTLAVALATWPSDVRGPTAEWRLLVRGLFPVYASAVGFLAAAFFVAIPAAVLDPRPPLGPFGRSARLTRGVRLRLWVLLCVFGAILLLARALAARFVTRWGALSAISPDFIVLVVVEAVLVVALGCLTTGAYVVLRSARDRDVAREVARVFT